MDTKSRGLLGNETLTGAGASPQVTSQLGGEESTSAWPRPAGTASATGAHFMPVITGQPDTPRPPLWWSVLYTASSVNLTKLLSLIFSLWEIQGIEE